MAGANDVRNWERRSISVAPGFGSIAALLDPSKIDSNPLALPIAVARGIKAVLAPAMFLLVDLYLLRLRHRGAFRKMSRGFDVGGAVRHGRPD